MSKLPKKLDVNDFWNDCLKESLSSKKSQKLSLNPLFNYQSHYKTKRNKKLYRFDTNPTFVRSKIIQNALKSEENTKAENNKIINESIDYMVSLYNKAMASKEKKRKKITQNREKTITLVKEACSFKPKKCTNIHIDKKINKCFGNLTIYERGLKYEQNKMTKMAKLFEKYNKKNNEVYSFHPNINNKNLNKVFYSNNYCKEQADNDSNKIFLSRLMKAREEEQYKKNCLENKLSKKREYFGFPKRLKKSLSQKDSLVYKNNLHNSIINLNCFPSNNENDKNNDDDFFLI